MRIGFRVPPRAAAGAILCAFLAAGAMPLWGDESFSAGPKVGNRVPAFSLPDQEGKLRTLDSVKGPRGAILVFIRSADW